MEFLLLDRHNMLDSLYAAADLNGDGVISVYESSVWAFDKDTVPAVPQYGDFGSIGQTTSIAVP